MGAVGERGAVSSQQFKLIAEHADKNTDKKAIQSGEREGGGMEVVEKRGCGGSIRSRFNPSVTIALTA